jgi:hypothetical protein
MSVLQNFLDNQLVDGSEVVIPKRQPLFNIEEE